MRELRGVIIEETEARAGTVGAMPVDAARDVLRAAIEQLMQDAIRFHEEAADALSKPAETHNLIFNVPAQPNHSAIRITTGAGKSEATRCAAADYVRKAKKRDIPHRVVVFVPTHKLGEEARQRFPAEITTALLQSRKANDLATGEPLCLNLAAVEAAEAIGAGERSCDRRAALSEPRRSGSRRGDRR
jgi:hypothetical protein